VVDRARPIVIIGAGSIGVGWATVFARSQQPVIVFDVDVNRLEVAQREFNAVLGQLANAALLENVASVAAFVSFESDLSAAVHDARHVQECIPESLELKKELFAELDAITQRDATLASSSSAIPCSMFAASLDGKSRCLVAHPANPPYLLPVVELVPAPFTSSEAVASVRVLMSSAGMSVVELHKEIEGFVYNRLQGALLREAYCLVRDGVVAPEDIDTIVHDGLGRRWSVLGPFETAELNTRGGIETHAARLGPAYQRMGAERGQHDPWTPELVAQVAESLHRRFPPSQWAQSVVWRDRALMELQRTRNEASALFVHESSTDDGDY
jgi:L-gulonate 3-dehydrogenase